MKLRDKILYYVTQNELARNKQFKNLHSGQECYIFGNGVSLKSMDFKKFNDKISMGCNSLFVHKDFHQLDCRYYQIPPGFLFYPYRKYYSKLERNYLGELYRKKMNEYKKVTFFTSISNILTTRAENVFYEHHFGYRNWDLAHCEMDGIFSYMGGGRYTQ